MITYHNHRRALNIIIWKRNCYSYVIIGNNIELSRENPWPPTVKNIHNLPNRITWKHYVNSVLTSNESRERLPKCKISAKFPIDLPVILQIQIKILKCLRTYSLKFSFSYEKVTTKDPEAKQLIKPWPYRTGRNPLFETVQCFLKFRIEKIRKHNSEIWTLYGNDKLEGKEGIM